MRPSAQASAVFGVPANHFTQVILGDEVLDSFSLNWWKFQSSEVFTWDGTWKFKTKRKRVSCTGAHL